MTNDAIPMMHKNFFETITNAIESLSIEQASRHRALHSLFASQYFQPNAMKSYTALEPHRQRRGPSAAELPQEFAWTSPASWYRVVNAYLTTPLRPLYFHRKTGTNRYDVVDARTKRTITTQLDRSMLAASDVDAQRELEKIFQEAGSLSSKVSRDKDTSPSWFE